MNQGEWFEINLQNANGFVPLSTRSSSCKRQELARSTLRCVLLTEGNFLPLVLGDRVAFAFAVDCTLFAVLQALLGRKLENCVDVPSSFRTCSPHSWLSQLT